MPVIGGRLDCYLIFVQIPALTPHCGSHEVLIVWDFWRCFEFVWIMPKISQEFSRYLKVWEGRASCDAFCYLHGLQMSEGELQNMSSWSWHSHVRLILNLLHSPSFVGAFSSHFKHFNFEPCSTLNIFGSLHQTHKSKVRPKFDQFVWSQHTVPTSKHRYVVTCRSAVRGDAWWYVVLRSSPGASRGAKTLCSGAGRFNFSRRVLTLWQSQRCSAPASFVVKIGETKLSKLSKLSSLRHLWPDVTSLWPYHFVMFLVYST